MDDEKKLSSTLKSYFSATNRRDIDAMIAAFADDAIVKDEGQEHRGLAAIRAWMKVTVTYWFKLDGQKIARLEIG
jgi:ketosteroid isomerase-like protein